MQTKPKIYDAEFVEAEVKALEAILANDKKILYLGELISGRGYTMQRISEWTNTFKDHTEISETIGKIKDTLQTRAVVGGLKNELNSGITKFHLINNFDWKDKQEFDHKNDGGKFESAPMTPRMLAATKLYEEELKKELLD